MKIHSLKWNAIASASQLIFNLVIFIIVARTLGAQGTGVFIAAQAVATPVGLICGLRSRELLGTEARLSSLKNAYKNVILLSIIAFAITTLLILYFTNPETSYIAVCILISNLAQAISQIPQGRLIRLEQFKLVAVLSISRGALSLICISYFLLHDSNVMAAYGSYAMAHVTLTLIEYIKVNNIRTTGNFIEKTEGIAFLEGIRYALSDSSAIMQISIARLFVSAKFGEVAVALFGTASMAVKFMLPVSVALLRTLMPDNAKNAAVESISYFKRQNARILISVSTLTIVFTFLGYLYLPFLVSSLFKDNLSPSGILCGLIMLGAAPMLGSRFTSQLLVTLRLRHLVEWVSWIPLVLTIILIWPFSLVWGVEGVAACLTISYWLRFLFSYYLLRDALQKRSSLA